MSDFKHDHCKRIDIYRIIKPFCQFNVIVSKYFGGHPLHGSMRSGKDVFESCSSLARWLIQNHTASLPDFFYDHSREHWQPSSRGVKYTDPIRANVPYLGRSFVKCSIYRILNKMVCHVNMKVSECVLLSQCFM